MMWDVVGGATASFGAGRVLVVAWRIPSSPAGSGLVESRTPWVAPRRRSQVVGGTLLPMKTALSRTLAGVAIVAVALRILATGYLPPDDALRHVAKAISGRPWSDILLLRPEFSLDSNPGWHAILGALHRLLGLGSVDLLLVSVVLLFVAFSLGPILVLRRPETWLVGLLLLNVVDPGVMVRLMSGRPFLLSSAVVPLVFLLWPRLEGPRWRPTFGLFVACGVASSWIHGAYYLLALPVLALLGAGRRTAGARLAGAFALGIPLGALLTGHPFGHLWQMLLHAYVSVGAPHATDALVTEFQPFNGKPAAVVAFFALLAWRRARRPGAVPPWREPVIVMAAGCWALGYVASRFWSDWSAPALATLAAVEVQDSLEARVDRTGSLVTSAVAAVLVLLGIGADSQQRWSVQSVRPFLSRDDPSQAAWLPGPGGIAYSAEMGAFYAIFFKNPDAPWRYVLGFEPAMMRPEDYAVYLGIKRSHGATESYLPWLMKMRPIDRLYVHGSAAAPPPIPGLEWYQPTFTLWAGRLPGSGPPPAEGREAPRAGPGPEPSGTAASPSAPDEP
jgi:hypothetical protein